MDVPSWHPANEDAARRQLMAPSTTAPRTEFKVMPGSSADTTTEAGRQLMNDLSRGGGGAADGSTFGGRGFFDASDRLYLMEQRKVEEAQKSRRKAEEDAQLLSFRSTSLKLQQSQKPLVVAPDAIAPTKAASGADDTRGGSSSSSSHSGKKQPLSAVVTIKPKKRSASTDVAPEGSKKPKPGKKRRSASKESEKAADTEPARTTAAAAVPTATAQSSAHAAIPKPAAGIAPSAPTGSLLLGYSSSSDSE
ncbi:hypothetical protein PybrP1_008826 [[Pythium] brassicae (nom. inval.)]|nr:hypothetical protein PybrP1_008826 [[Pythium] brassicae (nom. inval.)]